MQTDGVLSSVLFNLMTTDTKRNLIFQNVTLLMYVHDMALLSSNPEDMQAAFDSVNAWARADVAQSV
jgi:hypothetical protein